jgi:hypothetical protein
MLSDNDKFFLKNAFEINFCWPKWKRDITINKEYNLNKLNKEELEYFIDLTMDQIKYLNSQLEEMSALNTKLNILLRRLKEVL